MNSTTCYTMVLCYMSVSTFWYYLSFIEPPGCLGCLSHDPANKCVTRPQSLHLFLHLCLHLCFARYFIIEDEASVFDLLWQVPLPTLILESYDSFRISFLGNSTTSIFFSFTYHATSFLSLEKLSSTPQVF